jgi:hypothetical protein
MIKMNIAIKIFKFLKLNSRICILFIFISKKKKFFIPKYMLYSFGSVLNLEIKPVLVQLAHAPKSQRFFNILKIILLIFI